jgi:hypothetical protein
LASKLPGLESTTYNRDRDRDTISPRHTAGTGTPSSRSSFFYAIVVYLSSCFV